MSKSSFLIYPLWSAFVIGLGFMDIYTSQAIWAQESTKENPGRPKQVSYGLIDMTGTMRSEKHRFELDGLRSDGENVLRLVIRNSANVTLEKIVPGCSCTKALVPSATLKPGTEVEAEFQFSADKKTSKLAHQFDVLIHCSGAKRLLEITAKGNLTGHVGFPEPIAFRRFSKLQPQSEFDIPLVVSDDIPLSSLSVEVSDELRGLKAKLTQENGSSFLRFRFDNEALGDDEVTGDVIMRRNGGEAARLQRDIVAFRSAKVARSVSFVGGRKVQRPCPLPNVAEAPLDLPRLRQERWH